MRKCFKAAVWVLAAVLLTMVAVPVFAAVSPGSTLDIDGSGPIDLTAGDVPGTGWHWYYSSSTLTLDDTYGGDYIVINCAQSDTINLVYSGNVTINNVSGDAINCGGNLIIDCSSSGTLTLGGEGYGIRAYGELTITGNADVTATATDASGVAIYGDDVTITGNADVTATATGTSGVAIMGSNFTITGNADVTATATGTGGMAIGGDDKVTISGSANVDATGQICGIYVTDYATSDAIIDISTNGTVKAKATGSGGFAAAIGAVKNSTDLGDVKISNGTVITGSPGNGDVYGNLTVTGGTVTINGAVIGGGTTTHTGGTLNGVTKGGTQNPAPPTDDGGSGGGGCGAGASGAAGLLGLAFAAGLKKRGAKK
jgi:hypothetical protein